MATGAHSSSPSGPAELCRSVWNRSAPWPRDVLEEGGYGAGTGPTGSLRQPWRTCVGWEGEPAPGPLAGVRCQASCAGARGQRKAGQGRRAPGPHSGWGEKGWLCECAFAHLHVCVHASGSGNCVPGLPTHHPLSVLCARPWAAAGGSEMGPGGPAPGEGGPLGARVLCHRRWRVRVSTPVGTHGPGCPLGLGGAGLGGRHSPSSGSGSSLKCLLAGPGGHTSV